MYVGAIRHEIAPHFLEIKFLCLCVWNEKWCLNQLQFFFFFIFIYNAFGLMLINLYYIFFELYGIEYSNYGNMITQKF